MILNIDDDLGLYVIPFVALVLLFLGKCSL